MRRPLAALVALLAAVVPTVVTATTVYPIDRAQILAGVRFDFKIELDGVVNPAAVTVTVNGDAPEKLLGQAPQFVDREKGVDASALIQRDARLTTPGRYVISASDGKTTKTVTWTVYGTGPRRAKNVILFIGDGMSVAHRTAARILSKGITEGKYHGLLAMDAMPHMALIGTSGVDSVITDSANSMSAYTTGHKSSVNALGVYADRTPDTLDDPKVETISSL